MVILKFLLFVVIVAVAVVLLVVWSIYRKLHNVAKNFGKQAGGFSGQRQSSARTTQTDSGDTITDTRSEEQANRKIFAKDEGDYVDYVEK